MSTRTRPRSVLAEALRPERVDAQGNPEVITGDAPPEGGPAPSTSAPPPAPAAPPATPPATSGPPTSAPPAPPAPSADPTPAPVAAGITTGEILAALGIESAPRAHVTQCEPSPYLEAGGRISERFGFFSDLYSAGVRGDGEAGRRAAQFQSQLRDYIAAASTTTSSADIIPPQWGGQWYVEQLAQLRPAVSAFTSATITDPRPIPVPRFKDTTPPALVGDHVEGQPDTPGTVNFDQVTVTPKAKSGRAEISRELIDSSPQLADSVVSSALRESYSQITESTMCGVLEAGATAGPAGGATAVATEQAIRAALGALPGTRFLPGRVILPSSHVWGALVGADGPDGRPLFPYLLNGPTNAAGTTGAAYATGNIAGVETRPTWGLNPPHVVIGAGPSDAMSFESSLLEFRFEEKNGPELIEFDVWGYFAAVVLQAKGVILITSTATFDAGAMGTGTDEGGDKADKGNGTSSGAGRAK